MRDDLKKVGAFLDYVKVCLTDDAKWEIWHNRKNIDFQTTHGLLRGDIREEIEKLLPSHYFQGPMDDDSMSRDAGTVFVFKKFFEHETNFMTIYIKIKVPDCCPDCVVLSFHDSI